MVMTSDQIAQIHGTYQGAAMSNMMHAGMIGSPYAGARDPYAGESMVGRGMNVAGAIGSPAMMGGLALMGRDPFSMAFRGASAARGTGMLGMGAAGMAGAAAVGVPLMAAQWGMGQLYQGAQNQQMLNQSLRQNFSFKNPYGGTGFTAGGQQAIGQNMYQMAGQTGPMGESTTFHELGRLASNMGRMGMAQGVRDAKDFTEKFREMVKTLKTIATEMGTSLEEAQKMMAGMRQMGVFRQGDAAKMAGRIAKGASAGGLAVTELTGMGAIGSQISRMVGGKGGAGAQAGVEAITNVGVALQIGTLTEEEIYDTTGQTGAAGRRAFATAQLQGSARFLKGARGRRLVAALAGEDGGLNMEAAEEFAAGGMTTQRTMQLANENIKRIGRANFIRNEGRLRGEVMRQFGGMSRTMAMRDWLEGRGLNVDEGDDRGMLAFQRKLGMGVDESENMVRMIQDLPDIMKERKWSAREDKWAGQIEQRRQGQGMQGIKKKFDKAMDEINRSVQEVGAKWKSDADESVQQMVNKITGVTVQEYRGDLMRAYQGTMVGGRAAAATMERYFGTESYMDVGEGITAIPGEAPTAERFIGEFAKVDAARFREAGYGEGVDYTGGVGGFGGIGMAGGAGMVSPREARRIESRTLSVGGLKAATQQTLRDASTISSTMSRKGKKLNVGESFSQKLTNAYYGGAITGQGKTRLDNTRNWLEGQSASGDKDAKRALDRMNQVGDAKGINEMNLGSGNFMEEQLYKKVDSLGLGGRKAYSTLGEEDQAVGAAWLGTQDEFLGGLTGLQKIGIGLASAATMGPLAVPVIGALVVSELLEEGGGQEVGEWFRGAGRDLGRDVISKDLGARKGAFTRAQQRFKDLGIRKEERGLTDREKAEYRGVRDIKGLFKYTEYLSKKESGKGKPGELLDLARQHGYDSAEEYEERMQAVGSVILREKSIGLEEMWRFGGEARESVNAMAAGTDNVGTDSILTRLDSGEGYVLDEDLRKELTAKFGKHAADFVESSAMQQVELAKLTKSMEEDDIRKVTIEQGKHGQAAAAAAKHLSVKDREELAKGLAGRSGGGFMRTDLRGQARTQRQLHRAAARYVGKEGRVGGRVHGLADVLGIDISKEDIKEGMADGEVTDELVAKFSEKLGVTGGNAVIKDIIKASSEGKGGREKIAGGLLQQLEAMPGFEKGVKERREKRGKSEQSWHEGQMLERTEDMAKSLRYIAANEKRDYDPKKEEDKAPTP